MQHIGHVFMSWSPYRVDEIVSVHAILLGVRFSQFVCHAWSRRVELISKDESVPENPESEDSLEQTSVDKEELQDIRTSVSFWRRKNDR